MCWSVGVSSWYSRRRRKDVWLYLVVGEGKGCGFLSVVSWTGDDVDWIGPARVLCIKSDL